MVCVFLHDLGDQHAHRDHTYNVYSPVHKSLVVSSCVPGASSTNGISVEGVAWALSLSPYSFAPWLHALPRVPPFRPLPFYCISPTSL